MARLADTRGESYRLLYHLYKTGIIPKSDISLYRGQQRDRYAQQILSNHIKANHVAIIKYYKCDYCFITSSGVDYLCNTKNHPIGIVKPEYDEWRKSHPQRPHKIPERNGEGLEGILDGIGGGSLNGIKGTSQEEGRSIAGNGEDANTKTFELQRGNRKKAKPQFVPWEMWEPKYWEPAARNPQRDQSRKRMIENGKTTRFRQMVRRDSAENVLFGAGVLVYPEDRPSYYQILKCLSTPAYRDSFIWSLIMNHGIYLPRRELLLPGEPLYSNRMLGVLLTSNGWYAVYNTLGRFSSWAAATEAVAIQRLARELQGTLVYQNTPKRNLTFAVGGSMISAMVSGYLNGVRKGQYAPKFLQLTGLALQIMTAESLNPLFDQAYLVELNSSGLDSLRALIRDSEGKMVQVKKGLAESNPSLFKFLVTQDGNGILLDMKTGNEAIIVELCDVLALRRIRMGGSKVTVVGPSRLAKQVSKSLAGNLDRYMSLEEGKFIFFPRYDIDGKEEV